MRRYLLLLPVLIFAGLILAFYLGLQREQGGVPGSALTGKPAPALNVVALGDNPLLSDADLDAGPLLVNFWASWCGPCRAEHPLFMEQAGLGIKIMGVNFKDEPANAQRFLDELGNPFAKIGADQSGRTGIDWGLFGVPETFVIDPDGTIIHRHAGPLTGEIWQNEIAPLLKSEPGS